MTSSFYYNQQFAADYNYLDVLDVDPPMVTDQNVDIFVKLCKKLRFEYQPDIFTNPDLEVNISKFLAFFQS